jgi:hypothetical protein
MTHPIPALCVPAILEGVNCEEYYVPSEECKKCLKELGCEALLNVGKLEGTKNLEILEVLVWKLKTQLIIPSSFFRKSISTC